MSLMNRYAGAALQTGCKGLQKVARTQAAEATVESTGTRVTIWMLCILGRTFCTTIIKLPCLPVAQSFSYVITSKIVAGSILQRIVNLSTPVEHSAIDNCEQVIGWPCLFAAPPPFQMMSPPGAPANGSAAP